MASTNRSKRSLMVTRQQAADLISLSARQFDEAVRDRIPAEGRTGKGAKLRYNAALVVAAFVAYRVEQEVIPPGADPDGLLAAAGGNSPNLERLRKFTADLRERDVMERDRDLIRRTAVLNAMRPAISGMRAAGDRLTQMFGNEAGLLFNESIDQFSAETERLIGPSAGSTVPEQTSSP